jgi:hypothetical protein
LIVVPQPDDDDGIKAAVLYLGGRPGADVLAAVAWLSNVLPM